MELAQQKTCVKYGAIWCPISGQMKAGVARNVKSSIVPINGLRHRPIGDTTGWYIWAGEGDPPSESDFFVPLHVEHIAEWRPEILKFLGLPPGWRFLTDGSYEDVWQDPTLLDV